MNWYLLGARNWGGTSNLWRREYIIPENIRNSVIALYDAKYLDKFQDWLNTKGDMPYSFFGWQIDLFVMLWHWLMVEMDYKHNDAILIFEEEKDAWEEIYHYEPHRRTEWD